VRSRRRSNEIAVGHWANLGRTKWTFQVLTLLTGSRPGVLSKIHKARHINKAQHALYLAKPKARRGPRVLGADVRADSGGRRPQGVEAPRPSRRVSTNTTSCS
jgi:hypothetical protein